MKLNYYFTLLVLFTVTIPSFSQDEQYDSLAPGERFIFLKNGKIYKSGENEFPKKLLPGNPIFLEGDSIHFDDIKFYRIQNEYKGNYFRESGPKASQYLRTVARSQAGVFDIFSETYSIGGDVYKSYFYARKFGDLKVVNYRNLKQDLVMNNSPEYMKDNARIMRIIETGKTKRVIGVSLLAIGFSTFIVGGIVNENAVNEEVKTKGLTISLAGLASSITSVILLSNKANIRGLKKYNEVYSIY
jgi:hypothetical protein